MNYTELHKLYYKNMKNDGIAYKEKKQNEIYMNQNAANQAVGYIILNVITGLNNIPLPNAQVIIYVRTDENTNIPVMNVLSTLNPILIQLPVAYSPIPETITGETENDYSIYDMIIYAEGYYTTRILNIRMYPEVRTDFNINMIPLIREKPVPNIEQIFLPPLFQ